MPFLRTKRPGNMAGSEMRQDSLPSENTNSNSFSSNDPPTRTNSRTDVPVLPLLPSSFSVISAEPAPALAPAPTTNGSLTQAIPAPPATPPHDSPSTSSEAGMLSCDPLERPSSPPIQDETPKHRRFSMLRFRNASDSQLSARAKKQAQQADESAPPIPRGMPRSDPASVSASAGPHGSVADARPAAPEIITTAPTAEPGPIPKKQSRMFARIRRSGEEIRFQQTIPGAKELSKKDRRKTFLLHGPPASKNSLSVEEPRRPKTSNTTAGYGDGNRNREALALPSSRLSESSRSDESPGGRRMFGSTNNSNNNMLSSTSNFWRLPRRRPKQPEPLFPIAHLQKNKSHGDSSNSRSSLAPSTPIRASTSSATSGIGPEQTTPTASDLSMGNGLSTPPAPSPARALFSSKTNVSPATALFRPSSRNSGASSPSRSAVRLRGRSSTLSSIGRDSLDERLAPPQSRASTSTGRKSFGDLLGISRLQNGPKSGRQGSGTPATPGSNTSKDNSFQIQREPVALPDRREDENPARYLERVEEVMSRNVIAAALSKNSDAFSLAVLRSYMRKFGFFGDPMDMAIRKLLMEAELPKETQHIDRCLQAFANRYHECNPGIYSNPDQAYFIAFSLLILHTDVFNKNNKHKMQKTDYVKNTKGEGIYDEILEVFYDNISYTPFIHVEDDLDINGERIAGQKMKKKLIFPNNAPDNALKKVAKEPIDPYTLILDGRLDILRPNLREVMQLEDHLSYLGTARSLNMRELQKTFFRTGILQIVSARSRPDAFMSDKTATNPQEAQPGVVDIKITKVGVLWRKDVKKKKARSPWQEWGAILTGAQLYFFRNTAWVKNLVHQYEAHTKQGHDGVPIIFKPPLENFKPDALMTTDGAVALLDSTYKKHKHAFTYVRHGGLEEVLLADNEEEMNDWLAKLNYAAAFRTSGVRMRGVVGGTYEGQSRGAFRRLGTESIQTPTGEVTIARSKIDHKMAEDILTARRDIMFQKVSEANEKLEEEEKKLESQLRNARHLQILAPIQPKTRDSMLMTAAKMAAQLRWTRFEIWRMQCHRDILLMDLEDERQLLGLPPTPSLEPESPEKQASDRDTIRATTKPLTLQRSAQTDGDSDTESQETQAFQTPPTSSTASNFQRHQSQNSWELPFLNFEKSSFRKASISSAVSAPETPPRTTTSTSAPEANDDEHHAEVDADERNLLAQNGLLGPEITRSPESIEPSASPLDVEDNPERQKHMSHSTSADRLDKNKIRRSLQRTLRESAGHLSHARSRKGKDSASSGATDDTLREPEMLSRGSGSFVVHGKKASVITFGSEFQSVSSDERLRARKASVQQGDAVLIGSEGSNAGTAGGDFRVFLLSGPLPTSRRESGASASTATARSFRQLHRKYSSTQATRASSSGGNLAVPSDEDSDAISFSEGRHSPLPPIESESVDEEEEAVEDEAYNEEDDAKFPTNPSRETMFFTPEPPGSPDSAAVNKEQANGESPTKEREGVTSPTVEVVGA